MTPLTAQTLLDALRIVVAATDAELRDDGYLAFATDEYAHKLTAADRATLERVWPLVEAAA